MRPERSANNMDHRHAHDTNRSGDHDLPAVSREPRQNAPRRTLQQRGPRRVGLSARSLARPSAGASIPRCTT
eukprot:1049547-Prymnesium_polylepis.2